MKFEIGNKVKVIKNDSLGHPVGTIGVVKDLYANSVCVSRDVKDVGGVPKTYNLWHTESELELYEEDILKESTTMKNLLETEFVIENCTLSQRLAIKAYCDEKNIKYLNCLESCEYENICFDKSKCFSGDNRSTYINSVFKPITFSELIQFLDQYQPEPEFKVGDIVVVESWHHTKNIEFPQTCKLVEINKDSSTPFKIKLNKDHWGDKNEIWRFVKGEFRHATPEEIKKWKEENEIKLPKIADYSGEHSTTKLKWGCTTISISTVKELLELKTSSITIGNVHLDNVQIQQIKKFIEHNKL